jgi:hypothetical protein
MTLLRKLAFRISAFVERHASPGCKEWAEGLARELAFVEGDWAALGWALGSTRVLLDYREAPMRSLADVPPAAHKFVERLRNGYGLWFILLQGPVYFVAKLFRAADWMERAGCAVVVLGSVLGWIFWLTERHRLKEPSTDETYDDPAVCALFYKAELERYRFTLWIEACISTSYWLGLAMEKWHWLRGHTAWCAAWLVASITLIFAIKHAQRANWRRLARLYALLAGNA